MIDVNAQYNDACVSRKLAAPSLCILLPTERFAMVINMPITVNRIQLIKRDLW